MDQAGLAARKKSARTPRRVAYFQDESGVSLTPVVRATWAPRGQTPVLRHKFNWKRMSMSGAAHYRPDRSAAELVFATQPGDNTETSSFSSVSCATTSAITPRSPCFGTDCPAIAAAT